LIRVITLPIRFEDDLICPLCGMYRQEETEPICDRCRFDLEELNKEALKKFTEVFHVSWGRVADNPAAFVKTESFKRALLEKKRQMWQDKRREIGMKTDAGTEWDHIMKLYFTKDGFVPAFLAEDIMFDYIFITLSDTKEIMVYDGGIYRNGGEVLIEQECQRRLTGYLTKTYRVTEVINQIKRATYVDRCQLNEHAGMYLNLENGVIDLSSGELMEHSPEYLFTSKVPIEYDPEETCPKWESFLNMVLEEGSREALQMMFGECLTFRPCSKMFLLYGASATGKSTVLKVLEMLVGSENVAHEGLYALCGGDQWAIARLFGKKVNIAAELTGKVPNIEILKALTSGTDTVSGAVKYKDSIDFVNTAKLVFGMNKIPKLPATESVMRRLVMIPFVKVIPEDERIEGYAEKVLKEELSGILNWALEGLRMLEEKGYPEESYETKAERFERVSNSVETFANEYLIEDIIRDENGRINTRESGRVATDEVYEKYVSFCKKVLHVEPLIKRRVSEELRKLFGIETRTSTRGGITKRYYVGIRMKGDGEDNELETTWFDMR